MKPKYITPYADEWFSAPPPSVGWWPASIGRWPGALRWWDGSFWSNVETSEATAREAGATAKGRSVGQNQIKWAKRWWEKAE